MKNCKGLSVIELLVAIAVVFVLVSISRPHLARAVDTIIHKHETQNNKGWG